MLTFRTGYGRGFAALAAPPPWSRLWGLPPPWFCQLVKVFQVHDDLSTLLRYLRRGQSRQCPVLLCVRPTDAKAGQSDQSEHRAAHLQSPAQTTLSHPATGG